MRTIFKALGIGSLVMAFGSGAALAQPPCPVGAPLGVALAAAGGAVTIVPGGTGETFAAAGTPITVCITCAGAPLVGLPAAEIQVSAPGLFIDPGSNIADGPTGLAGCTTFTGTIAGGGCSPFLEVWWEAGGVVPVTLLGVLPIMIKSPDAAPVSPCFVDAGDLAAFAAVFASPATYSPCFDFDDSGPPTIDAGDLAYFASVLGTACP
jgi:hypothetical protein